MFNKKLLKTKNLSNDLSFVPGTHKFLKQDFEEPKLFPVLCSLLNK